MLRSWKSKLVGSSIGLFCGAWLCVALGSLHPTSAIPWSQTSGWVELTLFFAPLALVLWAALDWFKPGFLRLSAASGLLGVHCVVGVLLFSVASRFGPYSFYRFGAVGLPGALLTGFHLLLVLRIADDGSTKAWLRKGLLTFGAGLPLAFYLMALANIWFVVSSAERVAGSRPYCVQIGAPESRLPVDYRSVESLMDLNALHLQAATSCGSGSSCFVWEYHAALAVGGQDRTEWWNWSYRKLGFVPMSRGMAETHDRYGPVCQPRVGFMRNIPFLAP